MRGLRPMGFLLVWALVGGFLASALPAQRATVTYRDRRGKEHKDKGTITAWTFKGMTFRLGRAEKDIESDNVIDVQFYRAPDVFKDAQSAFRNGEYNDVLDIIGSDARTLKRSEAWAKEYLEYWRWRALKALNQNDEAKSVAADFVKTYPQSHFLPEFELEKARHAWVLGRWGDADKAYRDFLRHGKSKGYARQYLVEAGIGRIRCLLAQKELAAAQGLLGEVKALCGTPDQSQRVSVVEGEILLAQGKTSQAKSLFENLLETGDADHAPLVIAEASNGLGECYLVTKDWKGAAYAFCRTFALFDETPGLEEPVAWAFWRFSTAANRLSEAAKDEETKKLWRSRHIQNRERAASDFPMTRGGQEALKAMGLGR